MASRGRVLVVDDDPIVLRLLRARLSDAGFDVDTRAEALGTLQVVASWKPDIVLLDLNMPALGGASVAELLLKHAELRDTGIIFHSSKDLASLQEQAKKSGVLGAIAKTQDDKLFIAQFERLFARQQRGKVAAGT